MELYDRIALDGTSGIRITPDGYLVAMPRVSRTGIQLYRGSEVGMPAMDVVRVFRPETSVFEKDSMHTYAHRPITNDHPPKPVTAANWKDYAVGNSGGEVARDGEFMRVPLVVMDQAAIKDVKDGKSELSVGYSTELKWEKGTTPQGDAYDAIQTAIRVNHIAIVDAARGGPKLKIGDTTASDHRTQEADAAANRGDDTMSEVKTTAITVDGVSLVMPEMAAQIVQRAQQSMQDKLNSTVAQVTTLTADAVKMKADHEAVIAKMATDAKTAADAATAQIETLKKQVADAALSPEKIEAMVKDRSEMLAKAKSVLGDKLIVDKKTDSEIRRQVVDAHMGAAAKDWSDDMVKVSFDSITAKVKADAGASGVIDTANAFSRPGTAPFNANDAAAKTALYAKADKATSERWKNPGGAKAN